MNEVTDSPWTKKDIWANLIAVLILMSLASYMILIKSWVLLIFYWIMWFLYFTVGRYVVCRHCDYLGKPCATWCMGIIGGKLFKRSDKKNFLENGKWKFFVFALSFLFIAGLLPLIVYVYQLFTEGLSIIDWTFLIIYFIIFIIVNITHLSLGCKKCPIKVCPFNRAKE